MNSALTASAVAASPVAVTPFSGGSGAAVTHLTLTAFRSYGRLRLETDHRPVVLTGANGAGKTNLLEALSFLSPGRGLRSARLATVGQAAVGALASAPWAVVAKLTTPDGPAELATGLDPTKPERFAPAIADNESPATDSERIW